MKNVNTIAILQGIYWSVTGLWPMIHLSSFLWVTGPKKDIWLLYTVAVLILVVGLVLLLTGLRRRVTGEIKGLGIGSALGLIFIDVYYSLQDVISNIYQYDALTEAGIILLWLWAGKRGMAVIQRSPTDSSKL
ncbi:MAG: hypothetical protein KY428_02895 [Bacteroidetes bacterium]|nr:hypothetical protein [Bacteroidota bacterium]